MAERKEVLVVYKGRRRPLEFSVCDTAAEVVAERDHLLNLFSDLMDSHEGSSTRSSTECRSLYLQIESERWGGQLIELMGDVPNGAIVHLCEESTDCSKVYLYFL